MADKKAPKEKPGKVVRIDPVILKHLNKNRREGETVTAAIRRLMGLPPRKGGSDNTGYYFILPESRIVCDSIEEAKGEAILRAVRRGKKKPTEKPVRVRVINE